MDFFRFRKNSACWPSAVSISNRLQNQLFKFILNKYYRTAVKIIYYIPKPQRKAELFTLSETTLRFFLPFAFTDYISICAFQSHGTWVATQDTKNSWRDLWNLRNDTQSRICHSFQLNYRLWRLFSHAKYSNGWISKSRIPNSRNVPTNFLGDPHANRRRTDILK